jgi:DDE superfamily endonuclease
MGPRLHPIVLDAAQRARLEEVIRQGRSAARMITRARILLKADCGPAGPGWTDTAIKDALDGSRTTISRVCQRGARGDRATPPAGDAAAQAGWGAGGAPARAELLPAAAGARPLDVALAGGALRGAGGRRADLARAGAAGVKKSELKPWLKECWCIPPQANAAFVAAMEEVLEVYTRPYDPRFPQVCMDETSKQLLAEVHAPLPARPTTAEHRGTPEREDHEYAREGTTNLFLACEPLRGWRHVAVTARRTKVDWAHFIRELVDVHYPDAERLVLVLDNLNTHAPASLYEAFAPAEARRLLERREIHHTPKHGSWLNMAEIALSVLARQCLDQRLATSADVAREVAAWEAERAAAAVTIDWRFTTDEARIKLKHLYPTLVKTVPSAAGAADGIVNIAC